MATYRSSLIEALRGRSQGALPSMSAVSFLPNPVSSAPSRATSRTAIPRRGIFNPAMLTMAPAVIQPPPVANEIRPEDFIENLPNVDVEVGGLGDGGQDNGGQGAGDYGVGQGVNSDLADLGLSLMAYGEAGRGLAPGSLAAGLAGNVIAGQQADAMGRAADALAEIESQDVPGVVSVSDKQGNVFGYSSPATIAASDAATFGTSLSAADEAVAQAMSDYAESAPRNVDPVVIGLDKNAGPTNYEFVGPVFDSLPSATLASDYSTNTSSLSPADQAVAQAIAALAESAPSDVSSIAGTGGNIADSLTGGSTVGVDALGPANGSSLSLADAAVAAAMADYAEAGGGAISGGLAAADGVGMSGFDGTGNFGGDGGGGGGGGCFLTTAAVEHMGQDDDGDVLNTLRKFRDQFMLKDDSKRADVAAYYKHAPQIVEALNARPDAKNVYREMYETYILPAVDAIKSGDNDKAYEAYVAGVDWAMKQAANAQ